jgi:hypothetical protein
MWKLIENSNCEVSIDGEVRRIDTKNRLNEFTNKSGYRMVTLKINESSVIRSVHRLVAIAFIENPEDKPEVNHIDKNKDNNHMNNLEWVTPKDNMRHHYENGGVKNNNQTYKGKFGKDHNRSIKVLGNGILYNGISEASRLTGIPTSTISVSIKNNKITRRGIKFELASIA